MGKEQQIILDKVKKITKIDYDLSKNNLWDIIEDLIFEIEDREDNISDLKEKITGLQSREKTILPEEEYGY